MPRLLLTVLPMVMALLASDLAQAVVDGEYLCRSGNLVRRIVIEVDDPQSGLPCEVVYWKDQEAPGQRRVLWNARSDRSYCENKALGLTKTLSDAGWQCDVSRQSATGPAASGTPPTAATTPAPTAPATPEAPEIAEPSPVAPAPQANLAPSAPATPQANEAPSAPPAAGPPSTTDLRPDASSKADLDLVIEHNLQSLNQSVDGDFEAQIAKFGDLNGDRLQDAVVFFNYRSSGADLTQFVAAYLYNGKTYHLAATKPVGGTDRAIKAVEVENIVNGSILMKVHLNEAGTEASRRTAMVLQDGQLVETQ